MIASSETVGHAAVRSANTCWRHAVSSSVVIHVPPPAVIGEVGPEHQQHGRRIGRTGGTRVPLHRDQLGAQRRCQRVSSRLLSHQYTKSLEIEENVGGIGGFERKHRNVKGLERLLEICGCPISPADHYVGLECRHGLCARVEAAADGRELCDLQADDRNRGARRNLAGRPLPSTGEPLGRRCIVRHDAIEQEAP